MRIMDENRMCDCSEEKRNKKIIHTKSMVQ